MDLSLDSTAAIMTIRERVPKDKSIVFVSGNFNVLHPGHLRLLRFASECGDFLVVGVSDSNSTGAMLSEDSRYESVKAVSWVNYSFILHDTPEKFIGVLKPSIVVKGKEHESRPNPEQSIVDQYGGKLLFSSGDMRFSSLDLLRKEFMQLNPSTIKKPRDFPERHNFSIATLLELLESIKSLNVCVVGDIIVDEYITCEALGMSQEDPTIVVSPISYEKFLGGAGIVASHACGLGAKVNFFSITGKDSIADFARGHLEEYGVQANLYEDVSRPTTLKQRFRAGGKTLLRVSHLRQHDISQEIYQKMLLDIETQLENTNLVIFSDFNYGCLCQPLVDGIISLCKSKNIKMVADSQSSSQTGDVSRFTGMELLTPTEREARLAVRDFHAGLVILAENLRKKTDSKNVLITLGSEGLLIHSEDKEKGTWYTDRLPAFNNAPKDSSGAGDSLLTGTSLALAAGYDIWVSSYFGSLLAACQVGRIGNIPLSHEEIITEITNEHDE
jgi:rfaE bifunctional protein kinase chain/domain